MPRQINIPSQVYPPGSYGPFEINNLGQNDDGFKVELTRENWPAGLCVTIEGETSLDGVVWTPWFGATMGGGDLTQKNGFPLNLSSVSGQWPRSDGTKQWKGYARVSAVVHQTLRTAVSVEPI